MTNRLRTRGHEDPFEVTDELSRAGQNVGAHARKAPPLE